MSRKDFKFMVNQKQKWISPVAILASVGVFFYVITAFNKDALVTTGEQSSIAEGEDASGVVDLKEKGLELDEVEKGRGQGDEEQGDQGGGEQGEPDPDDNPGTTEKAGGSWSDNGDEAESIGGGQTGGNVSESPSKSTDGERSAGEAESEEDEATGGGQGGKEGKSGSDAGDAGAELEGAGAGKDSDQGEAGDKEEEKEDATPTTKEKAREEAAEGKGAAATPSKEEEVDEDKDLDEPEPDEPPPPPAPTYSFDACSDEATHAYPCQTEHSYRDCPRSAPNCVVNAPHAYYSNHRHRPEAREKVSISVLDSSVEQFEEMLVSARMVAREGDDLTFPGGAPQIDDVKAYVETLEAMVPELAFGNRTRVALDINGGVGSLAAALSEKNVLAITVGAFSQSGAVKMQIVAERNLPGVLGSFSRWQLPFAGHSFEMLHCGGCEIEWSSRRGKPLLEADRVLRPGGYFVWTANEVAEQSAEAWERVQGLLTAQLCYTLVKRAKRTAIFRKPVNEDCRMARGADAALPLCAEDAEETGFGAKLQSCISRLPRDGLASMDGLAAWPQRLTEFPPRLALAELGGINAKKEIMQADNKYWHAMSKNYVIGLGMKPETAQAALDMRANLGGFAHGMHEHFPHVWTLNVIPVSAENTLDLIQDRGLIGLLHDWCKPLDMPPRSFDLIHGTYLFPHEMKRCDPGQIVLEVDRLIRPGGMIVMRERIETLEYVLPAGRAIKRWHIFVKDTESGPLGKDKLLVVHVGQEHN